jgi:hypothetical protein
MAKTSININNLSLEDQFPKMMFWPYYRTSMAINGG